MSDEKVPTEVVEITSAEQAHEELVLGMARLDAGERVDIVLFDPKGVAPWLPWNPMLVTGL